MNAVRVADFLRGRDAAVKVLKALEAAGVEACGITASYRPDGAPQCDALVQGLRGLQHAPEGEVAGFWALITDALACDRPATLDYYSGLTAADLGLVQGEPARGPARRQGPAPLQARMGAALLGAQRVEEALRVIVEPLADCGGKAFPVLTAVDALLDKLAGAVDPLIEEFQAADRRAEVSRVVGSAQPELDVDAVQAGAFCRPATVASTATSARGPL
ncbi:MAG: hypothetical protein KGL43_08465 [Burkholderiales bacterium]|nr:hypothetical protein [Burkholderiales bacterium]MDE2397500.1 hypothetical protein [Burkholderiales bacterium]MDE2453614.1 hypothetical protein [Burkholderiales bacterium]